MLNMADKKNVELVFLKMPVNLPRSGGGEGKGFTLMQRVATKSSRRAKNYNREMEALAKKSKTPLVDVVKEFSKYNEFLFLDKKRDTIHPNPRGHKIISDLLFRRLQVVL